MIMVENIFDIGEVVYLKTDEEQSARIVTRIDIVPGEVFMYQLSCGTEFSLHYDFEITKEKSLA